MEHDCLQHDVLWLQGDANWAFIMVCMQHCCLFASTIHKIEFAIAKQALENGLLMQSLAA